MAGASYKIKLFYTNHQIHSSGSKHKHPFSGRPWLNGEVRQKLRYPKTDLSFTVSQVEAKSLFTMMKY